MIKRYGCTAYYDPCGMVENTEGVWVRYEDIKHLLHRGTFTMPDCQGCGQPTVFACPRCVGGSGSGIA